MFQFLWLKLQKFKICLIWISASIKYHNDLNNNVQYGQPGIENIPESMCLNNVDGNYQYNSTYLNSSVGNLNQLNYYYNMSNSDENMTMGGQFNDYNLANTSFY